MFARLLPITLRYVALAFRPDSPAEKDPTAMSLASVGGGAGPGAAGAGRVAAVGRAGRRVAARRVCQLHAERGPDLIELAGNRGELLERAERGQLRDELTVVLRLGRILVLQLRGQQLEERVLPQVARRRGSGRRLGRGRRAGLRRADYWCAHGKSPARRAAFMVAS